MAVLPLALLAFSSRAEIGVEGKRPDFFIQVRAALELLRERAPADYKLIENDIGLIKEVEAWHLSGMNPLAAPPTFSLSITTARVSVTWCAGAIAHDACHSRLWHAYSRANGTSAVPDSAWGGQAMELKCIGYQIGVMQKIGAPDSEIEDLRRADGLHNQRTWRLRER